MDGVNLQKTKAIRIEPLSCGRFWLFEIEEEIYDVDDEQSILNFKCEEPFFRFQEFVIDVLENRFVHGIDNTQGNEIMEEISPEIVLNFSVFSRRKIIVDLLKYLNTIERIFWNFYDQFETFCFLLYSNDEKSGKICSRNFTDLIRKMVEKIFPNQESRMSLWWISGEEIGIALNEENYSEIPKETFMKSCEMELFRFTEPFSLDCLRCFGVNPKKIDRKRKIQKR